MKINKMDETEFQGAATAEERARPLRWILSWSAKPELTQRGGCSTAWSLLMKGSKGYNVKGMHRRRTGTSVTRRSDARRWPWWYPCKTKLNASWDCSHSRMRYRPYSPHNARRDDTLLIYWLRCSERRYSLNSIDYIWINFWMTKNP